MHNAQILMHEKERLCMAFSLAITSHFGPGAGERRGGSKNSRPKPGKQARVFVRNKIGNFPFADLHPFVKSWIRSKSPFSLSPPNTHTPPLYLPLSFLRSLHDTSASLGFQIYLHASLTISHHITRSCFLLLILQSYENLLPFSRPSPPPATP